MKGSESINNDHTAVFTRYDDKTNKQKVRIWITSEEGVGTQHFMVGDPFGKVLEKYPMHEGTNAWTEDPFLLANGFISIYMNENGEVIEKKSILMKRVGLQSRKVS